MTGKDLKNMLAVFVLLVGTVAFAEQGLSQEEDLEINRQLKLLNKPAVKSFMTEYGDIIDCVDISKQPAFSHPLLKNHTIQMKLTTIPKGLISDNSKGESLLQYFVNINKCPAGSVPIRWTRKEDLIAAKRLKTLFSNPLTDDLRPSATIDVKGHHYLTTETRFLEQNHKSMCGTQVQKVTNLALLVCGLPEGSRDQENSIQAGWEVITQFFQSGSRLNILWTADGYQTTGCYNLLCPGFVQLSTEIIPGLALKQISVYNGPQFEIPVSIHQDSTTGNWLFMFGTKLIGHWPKALVPGLSQSGASFVSWGGAVFSPTSEPSPAMGSGHFPEEGFRKAAFVNQIQVAYQGATSFVDPDDSQLVATSTSPVCYSAIHKFSVAGDWGHHIYFGGPGNCIFS